MPRKRSVMIVGPTTPPYGGMAQQAQALCNCLLREGIEVKFLPTNQLLPKAFAHLKGFRTVVQSLLFLFELFRKLPRVGVVHILAASYFYFFLRVVPVVVLSRLFGRRVIINYRGGAAPHFLWTWRWLARPIFRRADALTVPSTFLQTVFSRLGFSALIIPNFIDLDRFRFHKRKCVLPRLLVNRNLEAVYNVKMVLRAFEKVKEKHPDSRLDIIGHGQQEAELKSWVTERNLRDVFFHGAVPNEEIPIFMEQADILLNPSNVDNMPINLLEAFASGVPVISTSVGGIPDLVGEERAALLVEPGNHCQMAEKIDELLTHPEKVEQLTTYARILCDGFSWNSIRGRLLGVYYPSRTTATSRL